MNKPIFFSSTLYKLVREYIEFDKKAAGFGLSFGKDLSEYVRGDIAYNYENATIYNVSENASKIIKEQEGTFSTSSLTPSIVRDSRDNYLDPSRGSRNSIYLTYAGLGGRNKYIKGELDSSWFFPIKNTTFMLRGRFGYAAGIWGEDLPLYERFYVGGIYTIRGLDWGDAGPKDEETGDPIGGTSELIFNIEYIFPIVTEMKLKGVVFFDIGNSYESFDNFGKFRYTTGAGIRWISPMGPIRVEWGYNLNRKSGEKASRLEFTFGSFF
jgi:outer membrane protein insertion porin family